MQWPGEVEAQSELWLFFHLVFHAMVPESLLLANLNLSGSKASQTLAWYNARPEWLCFCIIASQLPEQIALPI